MDPDVDPGMVCRPPWLWWLEDILDDNALTPRASDIVWSALEDDWIGSPALQSLLEKMTRRGLLRPGTLDAILDGMPRP